MSDTASAAALSIENLIYTYAGYVDDGDLAAVADLFSEAVIGVDGMDVGLRGRDRILGLLRSTIRLHDDGTPGTKHVTTNVRIEVDDDGTTASARSYFTVLQAVPGLPLQTIVAGRYRDRFALSDGRWLFVERRFSTDLVGDVSQHLLTGPEILDGA
ncbi:MAG: nuclear transport factor 2 family protein [Acidimicrobiales bacterium]